MFDQKSKFILFLAIILIILGLLFVIESQGAGKLRLVFCDVGQGDGMLIVTPENRQVVIDGGPGTKVVDCLGKKMPFWDHTIEMMILTHAQKDHMEGQIELFERYRIEKVLWNGVGSETAIFDEWSKRLEKEKSAIYLAKAGDSLNIKGLSFDTLWPSQSKINDWRILPPQDLNDGSVVLRLDYGTFCAYLTGDLPKEILEQIVGKKCQILKISHHGSKTGTNREILDKVKPEIAIIQVGKNSFGHPHKEVLNLLKENSVKTMRNDKHGIIEIETDGKIYKTKSSY